MERHASVVPAQCLDPRKVAVMRRLPKAPWEQPPHLSTFEMRLLLSALVDADHGDTARHYRQEMQLPCLEPKWETRFAKLEEYVGGLGGIKEGNSKPSKRDPIRQAVYAVCKSRRTDVPIYACDAPVGSGKTTAVMAYLLRAAIENNLRHIFVVLPFTNIINQSVEVYRKALVLEGEDPEQIVAAHHHATEFRTPDTRGLTTLWRSPIIVTTAVQFFETLAACATPRLRKLHALPGSAVFIDEAHAAIPLHLWPYMWGHLETLSDKWQCRFVLGSGSLPRLWQNPRLFAKRQVESVPSMLPEDLAQAGSREEKQRVCILTARGSLSLSSLCSWIQSLSGARLVVMNTLQSAAVLALELQKKGLRVLHLSTALTPADRDRVLAKVRRLLSVDHRPATGWVLVATSCIEAGIDVSFDVALRERSSVSSLIQISGRVNRHGDERTAKVWDFCIGDAAFTINPSLEQSRRVVELAFKEERWDMNLGDLMTWAIEEEWKLLANDKKATDPQDLETGWEFATVAHTTRLIGDDTAMAVVDRSMVERLHNEKQVNYLDLIRGSVSVRRTVINKLALALISYKDDLYEWPEGSYDAGFLGIMPYILDFKAMCDSKLAMV
jgi:CRISPR-associated endonuclease/helicase Cas3